MALINRNDYGAVAMIDKVINKMIVEELLLRPKSLLLCNKKGKLIKNRGSKRINPDCYDAVEVYKKDNNYKVRVYCVSRAGTAASVLAAEIMDAIEKDFETFNLDKPDKITVFFKGVMGKELSRRNIEVTRRNG